MDNSKIAPDGSGPGRYSPKGAGRLSFFHVCFNRINAV